jgi:hypothetical protein
VRGGRSTTAEPAWVRGMTRARIFLGAKRASAAPVVVFLGSQDGDNT